MRVQAKRTQSINLNQPTYNVNDIVSKHRDASFIDNLIKSTEGSLALQANIAKKMTKTL